MTAAGSRESHPGRPEARHLPGDAARRSLFGRPGLDTQRLAIDPALPSPSPKKIASAMQSPSSLTSAWAALAFEPPTDDGRPLALRTLCAQAGTPDRESRNGRFTCSSSQELETRTRSNPPGGPVGLRAEDSGRSCLAESMRRPRPRQECHVDECIRQCLASLAREKEVRRGPLHVARKEKAAASGTRKLGPSPTRDCRTWGWGGTGGSRAGRAGNGRAAVIGGRHASRQSRRNDGIRDYHRVP